jgi:type II secretory pathway component PulF
MLYRYEAIDQAGQRSAGTAEAGTPADARAVLRERGIIAFKVEPAILAPAVLTGAPAPTYIGFSISGRRLDLLNQFTRHLALLLRTGIPLAQALVILSGQVEDRAFRRIVEDVAVRVKEGSAFDEALGCHPRYFTPLYVHIARAGAAAGELPRVLVELAGYYARQKKLRDKVVSALTYPALMSVVGCLVLVFLLTFVVPKVTTVLLEQKRALPWPTEVLLWISNAFASWWWAILGGLFVFGLALKQFAATGFGRRLKDRLALGLPLIGDLYRKQVVSRWTGTMSTLLESGIPVAQALAVVRGTVGNAILEDDVARLEKEIVDGADLSDALKRSRVLPPSLGFIAGVGEESGELARVLREVADGYTEEVEIASGRLTDLINPILIVVLGVVIGFIVASILLPITDFSSIQG